MRTGLSFGFFLGGTVILMSAAAFAEDPMAGAYDNTVIVSVPNMGDIKNVYSADHTFVGGGAFGTAKGTWTLDGANVCRTQTEPPPPPGMPSPICEAVAGHKVGDTWQVEVMGQKFDAKLLAGKQL